MAEDQLTRIVAIRHGETDWNVDTRIQGQTDIALNATGRWQAERLVDAVAEEGIAAVYASDLARAWQTAQAVARGSGADVVPEPGLRERHFGIFEGFTFREIEQRWPAESERWRKRDPHFGPEGGETLQSFFERCITTATRLAAAHAGQTIALVAHGGVMDCLYRAAAGIAVTAPRSWQLGNAGINRLLYTRRGFVLVGWSDLSHLDGAAPPDTAGEAG
jgi:2,3-bisphosphoglycerate-dependent phosphoglycerate mutase